MLALGAVVALAGCGSSRDEADDTLAVVTTTSVPDTVASTEPASTPAITSVATTVVESTEPASTAPTTTEPATTEPATTVPPTTAPATTQPATTAAGPTTTVVPVLGVGRDGLGIVPFGTEAEATIAAVTAALGAPTEDTGWADPFTVSTCAGSEVRRVSWGALSLLFGDPAATPQTPTGVRQFFAYSYGNVSDVSAAPAGLKTPEGIGIGSPIADVRAAYPGVTVEPGEEGLIAPTFFVDEQLSGLMTGAEDTDIVTVIFGGPFCG